MTVRELFSCIKTDSRKITIYNTDHSIIFEKPNNKLIGKMHYWESDVTWIYNIDSSEIIIKIDNFEN